MRFKAVIKRLRDFYSGKKTPNIKRFLQDKSVYLTLYVIIKDFYTFIY